MEKPHAIRLPTAPRTLHDKIGPSILLKQERDEELEDPNLVYDIEGLAHLLVVCPATIETMVDHWMAREADHDTPPQDRLRQLFMMLLGHRPALQLTLRETVNFLGNHDRYDCSIAFFIDRLREYGTHDYEVTDMLLINQAAPVAEEVAELYTMRLKYFETGIIAHKRGTLFEHRRTNASNTSTTLSGFAYDSILHDHYDMSAFVTALVVFLLRFCRTMMFQTSDTPSSPPLQDQEQPIFLNWTELTREEVCLEVYNLLHEMITEIRSRCATLNLSIEIPTALCQYKPTVNDGKTFLFGVPLEVVTNPAYTLMWLEWMWKSEIWRKFISSTTSDTAERDAQVIGLLRATEDLWRAKSLLMYARYYQFFEEWDLKRLDPFLSRFDE